MGRDDDNNQIRYEIILDGEPKSISVHEKNIQVWNETSKSPAKKPPERCPIPNTCGDHSAPVKNESKASLMPDWDEVREKSWRASKFYQAGAISLTEKVNGELKQIQPYFRDYMNKFMERLGEEDMVYEGYTYTHKGGFRIIEDERDEYGSAMEQFMPDDFLEGFVRNDTLISNAFE